MTQEETIKLLQRMLVVNEKIVQQNHEIMSVFTSPRISQVTSNNFKSLTSDEVKTIVANASSYEWAVLMADSTIKAKNI